MIDDRVFLGFPLDFKGICDVYPPKVNDVSGNRHFNIYISLFTMTQEELEDAYLDKNPNGKVPTPFEYLMVNYYQDEEIRQHILDGFELFLHEPVLIEPELDMILVGKTEETLDVEVDLENPRLISREDYFDFQNMIRTVTGEKHVEPPDPNEDPRVKRIKAKGRKRDRIVARRSQGPKFGTLLAAICCMGIGLTPLNIGEMSYACVQWLIAIEQQRESYDIDIRSLLAGADSKKVSESLAYNIFTVYQRGHLKKWLTRNPQHIMVVGISWEDLIIYKDLWNIFTELLTTLMITFILVLQIILSKDGMNIAMQHQ